MSVMDFTPVQELLGKEVCFRDIHFEESFNTYKEQFKDIDFMNQVSLGRFKFGRINGCTVDLGDSGLSYGILLEETYYSLDELEMLFVSK